MSSVEALTETMRAFVVESFESAPAAAEFPPPRPDAGLVLDVRAAGLNPFDAVYSAGAHPSGQPPLPSVVGREGVGVGADGRRVFFSGAIPPYGSLAPRTVVAPGSEIEIRDDVDDTTAIGLGAAGLTAYLALTQRAEVGAADSVVVLGATGAVGRIAVQVATLLGAERVVAVGRRRAGLDLALERGADAAVEIGAEHSLPEAIEGAAAGRVDVVLDLLWGPPARAALEVASPGARIVQVGSSAATETPMPANPWRSRGVSILGFSLLNTSIEARHTAYGWLLEQAAAGRIAVDTEVVPFAEADRAWEQLVAGSDRRLVLEMDR